jgi:hypothetical protein
MYIIHFNLKEKYFRYKFLTTHYNDKKKLILRYSKEFFIKITIFLIFKIDTFKDMYKNLKRILYLFLH